MKNLHESAITMVAEGTKIEGRIVFSDVSRVHGVLVGEVSATDGSTLILSETAVVEGTIKADTLMVDGYVHGDVVAKTRLIVSKTGRIVGNIKTPALTLEFGAFFEGRCAMEKLTAEKI